MKHFFYSVLLLFCFTATAQINFEKGYFITNSQERTECYIKNVDWKDNPTQFEYKLNNQDSATQTGNITTVSEFGIYNESKYKRFDINIEKSGDDLSNLKTNKNPVWEKQLLFLKVLVEGDAILYVYAEDNLIKYFYETKTIPTNQLLQIKYFSNDVNSTDIGSYSNSIKVNSQFRQQLYNDVRCDNADVKEFENIEYNQSSLTKVFLKFNNCEGHSTSGYAFKSKKSIYNFKATASVSMATLAIKDPNTYYNKSTDISGKLVYGLGIEIENILPFNKNKWSLFFNPSYQKYTAQKSYIKNDGFGNLSQDIPHTAAVDYSYFELPFGIRHYMFLNDTSKLSLSAAYNFIIDSKGIITFDDSEEYHLSSRNNFSLGIGYTYRNTFSIELKTNLPREVLGNFIFWSAKYNTLGVLLSYKVF